MASKDRKARYLGAMALSLALLFHGVRLLGQSRESMEPVEPLFGEELRTAERAIMDRLEGAYGSTDWSPVVGFLLSNPGYEGNPNIMFIPLSLGNVALTRYESRNDTADLDRSLGWLGCVAENHWLWGRRWIAAPVVNFLDISLFRLRREAARAGLADRVDAAWRKALAVTEEEADARLTADYPYLPYDSSTTGDSKAEENAWEASLLAAAANFLPDHPHAAAWDRKARQLAYDAITRPSDPPDSEGIKVTTVTEDFGLANHGFFPNPTYAAATIELLLQGALTYRLTGREVPEEFGHNVAGLYRAYVAYLDENLQWTVAADPAGEPTLFPFAFDPELEARLIARQAGRSFLWRETGPVAVMEVGEPLWTAVLNSKAVLFSLVCSYLWHPPAAVEPAPAR